MNVAHWTENIRCGRPLVDSLNRPILADYQVEPYYVLQVIALRLGASCKRSTVLGLAADDIALHWKDAVSDMAAAVALLRDECGVLISKSLPSPAASRISKTGAPE